jgi:L-lactate dehydrogenase complex protein LldE
MTVSLFIPCLTEHLFPESGMAMVKIFKHLGVEVDYVDDQTCCGQPAFNSGYRKELVPVAERFIDLFKNKEYVVAPSGSCVSFVKCYYKELDIKEELKPALKELSAKIFEFSEFLVDVLKVDNLGGEFKHKVTYHDSCHLLRELGIKEQPRKLIHSIRGIDFTEMDSPDTCCGFGGTFSYKFEDVSVAMAERKCTNIEASGAEYCIGADSSCLMNIEGYLRKNKMKAKTMHIAELLALSLKL